MPPFMPPVLTPEELRVHFPLDRSEIAPATFEIGFALAGTVSAGAYTAGVLDYVIEALDGWTAAKATGDPDAPPHNVAISTIGGASGGAINGAVLLRAGSFEFPHGAVAANPLFNAWAGPSCVTLDKLLAPGRAKSGAGPLALFNTSAIESQVATILKTGGKPKNRPYLTNPLRLIASIGNLAGIPYRLASRGDTSLGLDMTAHADYVRFALAVTDGCARPDASPRKDEYALSGQSPLNWDRLGDAALATSAFPIAFDARKVERTIEQLIYRAVLVPGAQGADDEVIPLVPASDRLPDDLVRSGKTSATAVDGGTMDNEPIGVVRQELAGLGARNPRQGSDAHRAVLLVDPFADRGTQPKAPQSIFDLVGQVLGLFMQQARYKPEDLALAHQPTVFSRYLIAPKANNAEGSPALSAGALYGFLGFLDQRLLVHDFELGRYDAYLFLTQDFRVPSDNVVVNGAAWTAAQRQTYTSGKGYAYAGQPENEKDFLPIIPLVASLRDAPPSTPKPPGIYAVPDAIPTAIEARLGFVFDALWTDLNVEGLLGGVASAAVRAAWTMWGRAAARDWAVAQLQGALPKPPGAPSA